jgi:hypothetical protein
MKMGTTRSPWRYDAAARLTLQSVKLRWPAILHYASWAAELPIHPVALISVGYRQALCPVPAMSGLGSFTSRSTESAR